MSFSGKEYYNLTVSISKALNTTEMPLKGKHARAAIISTFHGRGGHSFWAIAIRQPLQENRIVAWKFCHLLHKVLREGHPLCLQHSLRHRIMLNELGKLWGHLTDGYGQCIKQYTKLLLTKLEFHERNPRFPGNLQLKRGELTHIGGNDINFYFQLAVEMFDYLDEILTLQSTIFSSITMYRVNSMTPTGQCRLAPLISLIQDSNQLYDFVVRIMFKLHANLSNELLTGHRERFRTIFQQLKIFFRQSSELQYFVNLISVPRFPDNPPNFKSQIDFGSYIPPVVVVPEPEPDPIVDNLVDTTLDEQQIPVRENVQQQTKSPDVDFRELIKERDELIHHLQFEIERLGKHIKLTTIQAREQQSSLEEEIASLNSEISCKHEEITNMRLKSDELEFKAQQTSPNLEQKALAEEEKARTSEEKFQKLKTMYTQIRDEHVKLLRQHGEVSKRLQDATKTTSDAIKMKEEILTQLEELQQNEKKQIELLQQNSNIEKNEKTELEKRKYSLEIENIALQARFEDLEANKFAEIAELSINLDKLKVELEALNETTKKLETEKIQLTENFVIRLKEKSDELIKLENEFKKKLDEKDLEILEKINYINENQIKYDEELLKQENKTVNRIKQMEDKINEIYLNNDEKMKLFFKTIIEITNKLATRTINDEDLILVTGTPSYFILLSDELQDNLTQLNIVYNNYLIDNKLNIDNLIQKIIYSGHLLASVHDQGITICNYSADIECGERVVQEMKIWSRDILSLYQSLLTEKEEIIIKENIDKIKMKLEVITKMINEMSKKLNSSEQIGDLFENELAGMDKSIEEAAAKIEQMLSQSRASDSGIKLEVNEKILDACTNLMKCIRILVQKSRLVQAEIISLGKGTASVKEFYKRNHQWTEGLISAAKNVAQGANFLVTAANKAVAGEAKHQLDLVVAAQEIAASTAQLVIASRVKAPRGSLNLTALGTASRNVTQATGAVVATAKDSSNRLEDSQDMDLTALTVHQAKTLEMEMQVKVLELEQALQTERLRLAAFRRKNYQSDEKL